MRTFSDEDRALVLGALDSLAVALTDHDHEWSEGEREIYEQAVACISATSPGDCTEPDSSALAKFPPARLFVEPRPVCGPISGQSRASACSDRPASPIVELLGESRVLDVSSRIYS